MIVLNPADRAGLAWCQQQVAQQHYLRAPVDVRCRALAYIVRLVAPKIDHAIGCLIFGRPEAQRCYDGALTYGSLADVDDRRARFDRWEVLNLARVWLSPLVQDDSLWCQPDLLPGFWDRRAVWRSTLASTIISQALARVGYDYLAAHPPVDCDYPYQIRAVLSYCDQRHHKGTIYRAAGFELARVNERQIETWYTTAVAHLTPDQDADIRRRSEASRRAGRIRGRRMQMELGL